MEPKELRLEGVRRSCTMCGNKHFNHKPCCDKAYCVSDLMRDKSNLEKENEFLKDEVDALKANLKLKELGIDSIKALSDTAKKMAKRAAGAEKREMELQNKLKKALEVMESFQSLDGVIAISDCCDDLSILTDSLVQAIDKNRKTIKEIV